MDVTFTRIEKRRYRVSVEGSGIEPSYMEPAPGYDDRLPHDAAHFIVENELGIRGGIFGQLAAGGHANTFRSDDPKTPRKSAKRGAAMAKANRQDALFSEHAVHVACSAWNNTQEKPATGIPPDSIARLCQRFDEFSSRWSKLEIGESITLEWKGHRPNARKRSSK